MKKKLTLTVEEEVVKYAQRLAKRHGKSVSQMFKEKFKDKEDAFQYFTAQHHEADYFITRNMKDYKPYVEFLPVMLPIDFIDSIDN